MADGFWTPIYEDVSGNQLIILNKHYRADSKDEAESIRLGSMLVECIILRLKPLEVREFKAGEEVQHVEAYFSNPGGHHPVLVAVLKGPLLDQALGKH